MLNKRSKVSFLMPRIPEFKVNQLVNLLGIINPHGVICSIINISLLIQPLPIQKFQITTHMI